MTERAIRSSRNKNNTYWTINYNHYWVFETSFLLHNLLLDINFSSLYDVIYRTSRKTDEWLPIRSNSYFLKWRDQLVGRHCCVTNQLCQLACTVSAVCTVQQYPVQPEGSACVPKLLEEATDRHSAPTLITFRVFVTTVLTPGVLYEIWGPSTTVVQCADKERNRVHNTGWC